MSVAVVATAGIRPLPKTRLLTIDHLVVRYGLITALNGVSVHIDRGEVVAIAGPNGAGKSTLLAAISGLVRPATGTIVYAGETIIGQPLEQTVRRGIALVPEGRQVFAGLTVMENLKLGATIQKDKAKAAAGIDEFLSLFPILAERRNEAAGRLSGGEQQMLVIARGLLSDPTLLMLDEPSLGLAPKIIDQVYQLISSIARRGVTVLVVEQNAGRALKSSDRTYVLNSGRVRLTGASSELAKRTDFEGAYFGIEPEAAARG